MACKDRVRYVSGVPVRAVAGPTDCSSDGTYPKGARSLWVIGADGIPRRIGAKTPLGKNTAAVLVSPPEFTPTAADFAAPPDGSWLGETSDKTSWGNAGRRAKLIVPTDPQQAAAQRETLADNAIGTAKEGYLPIRRKLKEHGVPIPDRSSSQITEFIAANPPLPGEGTFAWQGRIIQRLPIESQDAVLFQTRERYEPVAYIRDGMNRYCRERGLPLPPANAIEVPADRDDAEASARYFETAPDDSANPEVQAAYEDFKAQSEAMWKFLTDPVEEGGLGITIEFTTRVDPYATAEEQAADLRDNHHMWVETGLGGDHSSTMTTDEYDRFRAVHDVFGHAAIGSGFDRHGEYEAWLVHSAMYVGAGRAAMSTEYHGVNSAMWAGDEGSPGTGKSLLMPPALANPPWDKPEDPYPTEVSRAAAAVVEQLGLTSDFAAEFAPTPMHDRHRQT